MKNSLHFHTQAAAFAIDDSSQSSGDLAQTNQTLQGEFVKKKHTDINTKEVQQGSFKKLHFKVGRLVMTFLDTAPCVIHLPLTCRSVKTSSLCHRAYREFHRSLALNQRGWKCC